MVLHTESSTHTFVVKESLCGDGDCEVYDEEDEVYEEEEDFADCTSNSLIS